MISLTSTLDAARPEPSMLDDLLRDQWWYHQMNLGGGRRTPGQYGDNLIPVAFLMKHVGLDGMRCLDIGAMDAKMSFLMESLGGQVLAVDGVARPTVPALIKAYDSTVRYRSGVIVERLPDLIDSDGLFDFVLCSGVAYHVYSPFDLIANVRALLRNGGMALFETEAIPNDADLFMTLNRGDLYNEYTTLWIPSTACFRYMLRFLSMRILGEAELRTNDYRVARHSWLVQADRPSVLARETGDTWLATMLRHAAPGFSHEFLKPQFDHALFDARPQSAIAAAPIASQPLFKIEEPEGYADEAAFLAMGTPAWRHLR